MSKQYELLKDIQSPIGCVNKGVIGKDDGYGRIWFQGQYYKIETCDANPSWFREVVQREWEIVEFRTDSGQLDNREKFDAFYKGKPLILQLMENECNNILSFLRKHYWNSDLENIVEFYSRVR